jgi:hypothetical protein
LCDRPHRNERTRNDWGAHGRIARLIDGQPSGQPRLKPDTEARDQPRRPVISAAKQTLARTLSPA